MHILENVAIRDGGKMLYESIFILECEDSLVLSSYDIFKKIDEYSEINSAMVNNDLIMEEVYDRLDLIYIPRLNTLNDT